MKATKTKSEVIITLTMNEEEAVWIRDDMQYELDPENLESPKDRKIREAIWEELNKILQGVD